MKKNDLLEITVDDLTSEGFGVGHKDGFAIFIPNAATHDKLLIKLLKIKKNYAYAKIEKILTPSKDRENPDCVQFEKCGGCTLRHISYQAELDLKYKRVCDCIKRIGGFSNVIVDPIVKADNINFYRNKIQMPVRYGSDGKLSTGFYSLHSHKIVNCLGCKLHPKIFSEISSEIINFIKKYNISVYNEQSSTGLVRHIYMRTSQKEKEIMVCLVINGKSMPFKEEFVKCITNKFKNVKSIMLNFNTKKTNVILGPSCETLWGQDYITDELCDLRFNISPLSFYQVNRDQAEKLYTIAKDCAELNKGDVLLDLYCGTGTIGIYMSKYVDKVIGVEIIEQAIENANINAKNNNANNIKFICDDAEVAVKNLGVNPSIIVMDPPRKGCSPETIKTVCEINPLKIVYVSCDPATLARDMKILSNHGYLPKKVIPVDLFPRTMHVETIVLMSKENKQS